VAANVTAVFAQTVVPGLTELMLTDGVFSAFTVIVICVASAVLGEAHASLEVSWQSILSPLTSALSV
jgi:hypothetical protein